MAFQQQPITINQAPPPPPNEYDNTMTAIGFFVAICFSPVIAAWGLCCAEFQDVIFRASYSRGGYPQQHPGYSQQGYPQQQQGYPQQQQFGYAQQQSPYPQSQSPPPQYARRLSLESLALEIHVPKLLDVQGGLDEVMKADHKQLQEKYGITSEEYMRLKAYKKSIGA
ncbi:UNVERIFIED_CONTAM: hypothetical protein HDU68_000958 [Siphonaria sp. JEL0065]|nr:hypothetical protein HDU68_000958 [Siphonaria sp. JEL0065]